MIRITVFEKDGEISGFRYKGHAGYGEYGQDIVCAGVSAQLMMAYNGITDILGVETDMEMSEDGGFFSFTVKNCPEEKKERCQLLLKTLRSGIESIMMQYDGTINLKEEEV